MKKLLAILTTILIPLFAFSQHEGIMKKVIVDRKAYIQEFLADGGSMETFKGYELTSAYYTMAIQQGIAESIEFGWMGEGASKKSVNATYSYLDYFDNIYSFYGTNHGEQATLNNKPFVTGDIAPNEHEGMKNPNGGMRYMTHPTITFGDTYDWSVTTVIDAIINESFYSFFCNDGTSANFIGFDNSGKLLIKLNNVTATPSTMSYVKYMGKHTVFSFVYNGTSIGVFVNGTHTEDFTITSSFTLSRAFYYSNTLYQYQGTISAHIIRSEALTATQVAAEAALLSSIYPEIQSKVIGTQTWQTSNCDMVATPIGTVIPRETDEATWATSQTLYDNYLSANPGDTYGATKAAAMWDYYGSDTAIGAVYGKLYNGFAVDLIGLDITTHGSWGWHVPTIAEAIVLRDYLGGATVAGGKMKVEGLDYWTASGGTNISGFSGLGAGYRSGSTGGFSLFNDRLFLYLEGGDRGQLLYSDNTFVIAATGEKKDGYSLRLIKD